MATMDMNDSTLEALGDALHEAQRAGRTVEPLTARYAGLGVDAAYRIQQRVLARRLAEGERVIGKKVGVTSQAVMDMLGVGEPDFGWLTDAMLAPHGGTISAARLIQPKAEGEIAFVLKRRLQGPGIGVAEVLAATECLLPCIEVVDSRIQDWRIRIGDTVADNASCGMVVLGDRAVSPLGFDLHSCGMVLEKNGEVVATGAGAAALGSPANAVAWLANTLGRLGLALESGEVVLSGALAAMCPVAKGDHVRVSIGGLGGCAVRFV